jgi:hypothetical protein
MDQPPEGVPPDPHEQENQDLSAAYEKAKREFTEEDLQRYTVEEPGFPLAQVIHELEEIERQGKHKGRDPGSS